jgi:two-component system, OmpR family, KDP operon response regulator KdpE
MIAVLNRPALAPAAQAGAWPLSPKEYRILRVLAHAGNVVTHRHLLKQVWGVTHLEDAHYLRIFIRKVRKKIEKDPTRPEILLTELGVGYRLAQ